MPPHAVPRLTRAADHDLLSRLFRCVEATVRLMQQVLDRVAAHVRGDAEAHRQRDAAAADDDRRVRDRHTDAFGEPDRTLEAGVREDDGELLAAQARRHIELAYRLAQDATDD